VSTLFAAFLGYSPMQHLLGPAVLSKLPQATQAHLLARTYFPHLIERAFGNGLHTAFDFAIVASLVAAGASWLRGGKYVYSEPAPRRVAAETIGAPNGARQPTPAEAAR
jgi:hypothetical protein